MAVSPLPVVPRPLPEEYLTAWFGRVAGVYSMTSLELLDHIAKQAGGRSLSDALSHHPNPDSLAVLSRSLGLPVQTLVGLTVPRLRPLWGKTFRTACYVGSPSLHCPACLAGDEAAGRPHHLRVDWTCALAFHCPVHDIPLVPGCPVCRHPVLVFSGPPATARLHCALCRTRLGTRSAESSDRLHHPGRWPTADRRQGPDPQPTHEAPFRTFMKAAIRSLAWTPTEDGWSRTGCPAAVRAMLVGLLEVLELPPRFNSGPAHRTMLADNIRLPWTRMAIPVWLNPGSLISDFSTLPGPVRFDLLVTVYAMFSGAERLISFRQWSPHWEDWRVYCLGDPIAQLLCAADPEAHIAVLERSKSWAPPLAQRFAAAYASMQGAEDERRRVEERHRDRGALIPITEASLPDRYFFLRDAKRLSDYDMFTVDDLLVLDYPPKTYKSRTNTDAEMTSVITAGAPAYSRQNHDTPHQSLPVPAAVPPLVIQPDIKPAQAVPELAHITLSPDLFLAAAHAAIAVEGPSRAEWADPKSRRLAWFRMMKEAGYQLERLKKERHSAPAPNSQAPSADLRTQDPRLNLPVP